MLRMGNTERAMPMQHHGCCQKHVQACLIGREWIKARLLQMPSACSHLGNNIEPILTETPSIQNAAPW